MSRSLSQSSLTAGKKLKLQRKFYEKLEDFTSRVLLHSESGYVVYRAKCRYSMGIVVLKGYGRDILTKANKQRIQKEVEILQQNECPFLIRCFDCFEDQGWWWLVLENCAGGDLYGITQAHPEASTNEGWLASQVVLPMLQTLAFLHDEGMMHRDFKAEHVLFNSEKVAKLGGFFLCHDVAEQGLPTEMVGEIQYSAPEMIISGQQLGQGQRYGYDHKVDVWSLGVLIYECLVGQLPFQDDDPRVLQDLVLNEEPDYPPYLSDDARDFISQALQKEPEERAEASTLLDHPWITTNLDWIPDADFEDPVVVSSYFHGAEEGAGDALHRRGLQKLVSSVVGWVSRSNSGGSGEPKGLLGWMPGWGLCAPKKEKQPQNPALDWPGDTTFNDDTDGPPAGLESKQGEAIQMVKASFKKSFGNMAFREEEELLRQGSDAISSTGHRRGSESGLASLQSPHESARARPESPPFQEYALNVRPGHLLPLDPLQPGSQQDQPLGLKPLHPSSPPKSAMAQIPLLNLPQSEADGPGSSGSHPSPHMGHHASAVHPLQQEPGSALRRTASGGTLPGQFQRAPVAGLMQSSSPSQLSRSTSRVLPDPSAPYPIPLDLMPVQHPSQAYHSMLDPHRSPTGDNHA